MHKSKIYIFNFTWLSALGCHILEYVQKVLLGDIAVREGGDPGGSGRSGLFYPLLPRARPSLAYIPTNVGRSDSLAKLIREFG